MKASIQWLKQWVNFADADLDLISSELTLRGLEVEAIEPACAEFTDVYVGKVIACEKHPDADKLSLCKVDVGDEDLLQIICGARNIRANLKVAVAKVGALLPGIKIKKAKLRGVESCGMICSEAELGLLESADGIMELPEDAPVGVLFKDYYELNDQVINVSLTPNRGDCASILGLAREIALIKNNKINNEKLNIATIKPGACQDIVTVHLDSPKSCPKYIGRVIKNVNNNMVSPVWLTECLRRAGLRSVNLVVDVTNFVLLELGQPMHAFDLDKIEGDIKVRNAQPHEKITLLDDTELDLDKNSLVIVDDSNTLALAGVMGGYGSATSKNTQNILLESAYFFPEAIAYSARKYRIQSESSYRFERGVDPSQQLRAIERATQLIIDIAGGEPGPVNITETASELPKPAKINLRFSRVNLLLGVNIEPEKVINILQGLSMNCERYTTVEEGDCCLVTPPEYRGDIAIEADLIEEILRIIGCDAIPEVAPLSKVALPPVAMTKAINMEAPRLLLKQQGYHEIISYSFVEPKLAKQLNPEQIDLALTLANPISKDMAVMRTSLWPGLMATALHNLKRQQTRIKIFEYGLCFTLLECDKPNKSSEARAVDGAISQLTKLAGLVVGDVVSQQWGVSPRKVDYFDVKSDVEALLGQFASLDSFSFKAERHPALHPGQSASVYFRGDGNKSEQIGWLGVLHPGLVQKFKLVCAPVVFELNYQMLIALGSNKTHYRPISKFPELRRDLAFVVDKSVYAADLLAAVKGLNEESLLTVELFDHYQGDAVPEGKKSLALSLVLQDFSKTLVDEDVAKLMRRVITLVESEFSATLRD